MNSEENKNTENKITEAEIPAEPNMGAAPQSADRPEEDKEDAGKAETAEKAGTLQDIAQQPGVQEPQKKQKKPKKRKRFSFLKGLICGFLLSVVVYVFSTGFINIPFLGSFILNTNPEETVAEAASPSNAKKAKLNYGKINLKMRMIQTILDMDYYYTEDAQDVEDGIFTGMMYGLSEEDPYATYYPAKEFAEELNETQGQFYGIGALISQNFETNVMTIEEVYEGSPAEEAGLLAGDILKKVNQEDVTYMELDTVVNDYVKGEEGTYVNITVERDGEMVELQIMRGRVEIPSVYASLIPAEEAGGKATGYIYVSGFDMATVDQFADAVDELTEEGAEGIVIDLRENPGGVMNSALYMLDYLLADDIGTYSMNEIDGKNQGKTLVLYTETKRGRDFAYYAGDGHETELPLAVLIDEYSASASEIFAGVLKDYKKAVIVGKTSYGKGIVQTEFPLPDGSAIKYTSAQYFTPSGYAVHGTGVVPDVEAEVSEAFLETGADPKNPNTEADDQLIAAIGALYAE